MRRLFAAAILAAMPLLANATSYSTDITDLWYIPAEAGWGVNFIQQEDTLFATLFVYGPDGSPTWYVAPGMQPVTSGSLAFVGDLFATTGPWFATTPFNPTAVANRKVGIATFTLNSVSSGTFTYQVDGLNVTKQVVRQTWKFEVIGGTYVGALSGTSSGCAQGNGYSEQPVALVLTQDSTNNVSIVESLSGGVTCNYTGNYTQAGRMGTIVASGNCGSLEADEVQANFVGITFRLSATASGSCQFVGKIAATRR